MKFNYKIIAFASAIFLSNSIAKAQVSEGGTPLGISRNLSINEIPVVQMPETPVDELIAEDKIRDTQKSLPYRFGYNHFVNLNLENSGVWKTLADGSKLWRVAIASENAQTMNLTFDKYKLPEGAKLFVYSADKSEIIGAFTKRNNQTDGYLGCTLVKGELSYLEYYEPAHPEFSGELQLWRVTHGYRSLRNYAEKSYGQAGTCNNNVNCPIGVDWQDQKRSVACIVVGGNESCTGALVNDVAQDGTPYFLTANHCTTNGTDNVSTWVFRFNWESATCTNANGPTNQTVSGATYKANSAMSDVALLQLNSVPPASYNVYYSGWSNLDIPADSLIGIHHPSGDIKKISFAPGAAISSVYSSAMCWQTAEWFDGLQNGATEPGSSGSPLFDTHHRIVGQLYGGPSNCNSTAGQRHDFYGKFSSSWDSGATAATRLKDWLDPQNTGATFVDGMNAVAPVANNTGIAGIVSPTNANNDCGLEITPIVTLFNYGSNLINAVTIKYKIDAGTFTTFNWTGSLAIGGSVSVTLPAITSPSAGVHNLTVTTDLPNGTTDGNPNNDSNTSSFTIIDPSNSVAVPFVDDLTMTAFPGNGWSIYNPDNNTTWAFQTTTISNAPGSTGKSLRIRNKQSVAGQVDYAITPFYNFVGNGAPLYMSFYHSYRQFNTTNDSLIIVYSNDCAKNWIRLKGFSATDLALNSGGNTTSTLSFTPSADSMWVSDTINIDALAGLQGVQFAFICKSDAGNSLFIDAINIQNNPLSVINISDDYNASIFPNPASDILNINFKKQGIYTVSVKNILGENVFETKTNSSLKIETSNYSKGVYFVEIKGNGTRLNKKVIIK